MIESTGINPSISYNPNIGKLIYPRFNRFCEWLHGSEKVKKENGYSGSAIQTSGLILKATKAIWPLHIPLQLIGLFNDPINRLAKAVYGTCWPIIYSAYRPFAPNKRTLEGDQAPQIVKSLFNINEHLRVWAGSTVSLFYGGGGLGMLWGSLTRNDDFFDKASRIYQEWMLNQNFVFGVMNLNNLWLRKFNPTQVQETHRNKNTLRSHVEFFDGLTLLPNAITRTMATFRLCGGELSEGTGRLVDSLGFLNYSTWAYRYGDLKGAEEQGGDLDPVNPQFTGAKKKADKLIHDVQKIGSLKFRYVLAPLSLGAAIFKATGFDDLSSTAWKLGGILERLQTAIGSWCVKNTWFKWFTKNEEAENKITQEQTTEEAEPIILPFEGSEAVSIPPLRAVI